MIPWSKHLSLLKAAKDFQPKTTVELEFP